VCLVTFRLETSIVLMLTSRLHLRDTYENNPMGKNMLRTIFAIAIDPLQIIWLKMLLYQGYLLTSTV
jgi:hypothetical protein